MKRKMSALSCLSLVFLILPACSTYAEDPAPGKQTSGRMTSTLEEEVSLSYLLYLPEDYDQTDEKWPLMLFLHGMGERGKDLEKVQKHGPPKLIEQGREYPFLVVSPQCPADQIWRTRELIELVNEISARYRVDERRIYVTGLSMGAYGTWKLAAEYPERIAAIAPISGGGSTIWGFELLNTPVWAFHGKDDPVVAPEESRRMVNAVRARGNNNVKLTLYDDVGHNAWDRAYDTDELYDWLLRQRVGPALFFREDWAEIPPERPITQEHVAHRDLKLFLHGPGKKNIKKSHHEQPPNDPYYVWSGRCERPWAVSLRHRKKNVDLSGRARIRWRTKQSGLHQLHLLVKLEDGPWLVSKQADGPSSEWHVHEFDVRTLDWYQFDITSIHEGKAIPNPDLKNVSRIGFTDLRTGGRTPASSRVDWIEVYGPSSARK